MAMLLAAATANAQDATPPSPPAAEQAVPVSPAGATPAPPQVLAPGPAAPSDVPAPETPEAPSTATTPEAPAAAAAPAPAAQSAGNPAATVPEQPGSPPAQPLPPLGEAPAIADPAAPSPAAVDTAQLPRDLSPWNMFIHADLVVKAVMIGLAFASVVTWTVWVAKSLELTWAKRRVSRAFAQINASGSLAEAAQRLGGKSGLVYGLIELAAIELRLSADVPDKAGIKERVASRLDGLVLAAGRDMNRGTGVLATIGSTSPFVGLFGTVWGIMNSFIGISEAQTTNLAIVAPGIAEALLATAIGLVAAIPAVIIYNHFARQISAYKALIGEASAEVMRLVSRDLDRGFRIPAASRAAE